MNLIVWILVVSHVILGTALVYSFAFGLFEAVAVLVAVFAVLVVPQWYVLTRADRRLRDDGRARRIDRT